MVILSFFIPIFAGKFAGWREVLKVRSGSRHGSLLNMTEVNFLSNEYKQNNNVLIR